MPPVALRSRTPTATAREYPTEQLGVDLLSLASYAHSPKSTLFTVLQRSTSSGCTLSAITMHSWNCRKRPALATRGTPVAHFHSGRNTSAGSAAMRPFHAGWRNRPVNARYSTTPTDSDQQDVLPESHQR